MLRAPQVISAQEEMLPSNPGDHPPNPGDHLSAQQGPPYVTRLFICVCLSVHLFMCPCTPGAGMATQLAHVRVVLGQDGDGITLLSNDQPSLLLRCTAQVDAVELKGDMPRLRGPAGCLATGVLGQSGARVL